MLRAPLQPARTATPRVVPTDPTQDLLRAIKIASPWMYESLRFRGVVLDEDLPTIRYR